jgi:hypothetical protein
VIASVACLSISGGMWFLSLFCLCTAGRMVIYFLVAAAFALLPFGYDPNRARRLAGLCLIGANIVLAGADHQGGVKWDRQHAKPLESLAATEPATR